MSRVDSPPILMCVPNVSEGRDVGVIDAIAAAFASVAGVRLLDVHRDGDHHRSVYTLAGPQDALGDAVLAGAREAVARVDVVARANGDSALAGQHPHVGALDVVPVVHLGDATRGAACAEALRIGDRLGAELRVPVLLYGELTADAPDDPGRTRAELRRGGVAGLRARLEGEPRLRPDFGPGELHASAGATLLAARAPLVAFNVQLLPPADLDLARAIAACIREGAPEGLDGVRAIGVQLRGGVAQVSTNVERPERTPLAAVVEAVARHAPVASTELVGLAPAAALASLAPELLPKGFDAQRHVIENALRC